MKKAVPVLLRVLTRTCILYTVLSLALFLVQTAIPESGSMVKTTDLLMIFLFSLLLACANLILGIERIGIALRVLLHYLASGATYWAVFMLIAQKASGATAVLSNLLFFTILYALVMGFYLFAHYSLKASEKPRAEKKSGKTYQSIYKK